MSKQGNKALIGSFVVGAIVLAVMGILAFGSGTLFSVKERYVMYFDGDLKGLNVGAPVTFRGVRIGQVAEISVLVDPDTLKFTVPVVVEIISNRFNKIDKNALETDVEENLLSLIDKGLRAQLVLQNIVTGQLMIQLDIYPNTQAKMKNKGDMLEIPTIPSGFQRLTQAIEEISFNQLVDNINRAVTQFGQVLENKGLEKALSSMTTLADEMAALAHNLNAEAIPMIQSVKQTSDRADGFIQEMDQQVDPVITDTRAALASIHQTMAQAEQTLKSLDALAAGYTEQSAFRYEVSNALREITAAANSMRTLTDLLQQHPEALIRGKGNPEGR